MSHKPHTCHALQCNHEVKPELLMCLYHWRMVPQSIQSQVWKHYRRGQCDDKSPSRDWLLAACRAISHVAVKEGILTKEQGEERVNRLMGLASKQKSLF